MFELFTNMMREEWRVHSTLFGSLSFALYPVMIFVIAFMGSFVLPFFAAGIPPGYPSIIIHAIFLLLGIMVGGFGLMGREVMNRRFGQASLLAYSARSLPITERHIFVVFVIKDTVYYLILCVLPFVFGFTVASPFLHIPLALPLLLFLTLTLAFLTGLALIFFLSTVYARSKHVFILLCICGILAGTTLYLSHSLTPVSLFPPLQLFYLFSWETLLVACAVILIPSVIAAMLFTTEFADTTRKYKPLFTSLARRLSFFPYPPLATKDLLDLERSGSFVGQVLFSFLIPLCLLWFLLSILTRILPAVSILLVFSILTGVIAAMMYTWLTMLDTFNTYSCLPISVPTLLSGKISSFTALQLIPAIFIAIVSIAAGGLAYLVPALVICLSVSFYTLGVTCWLTGLSPNVLIYDAKVLVSWFVLVVIALFAIIVLIVINPFYTLASSALFLPAWGFVKLSYAKWNTREQPGF
ncbi:MAG: hypothetical protein NTZ39_09750 [Methanoregula sp.]|nr:hypothetical protein [Methanoregula sp.]